MENYIKGNLQFVLKPNEMIVRNQDDCYAFLEMKAYILRHLTATKARYSTTA